jgi:hypothetical protein
MGRQQGDADDNQALACDLENFRVEDFCND